MVIVIRGKRHWLWRAVDNEGTVLDFLVQSRRNTKAGKKADEKPAQETEDVAKLSRHQQAAIIPRSIPSRRT